MRTKHVLDNIGTSKVFYLIMNRENKDKRTRVPKEIAKQFRVKSPSAIDQLKKLRLAGLLKYGEKNGQFQPYEINLEGISNLVLEKYSVNLHLVLTNEFVYPKNVMIKKQLKDPEYWMILTDRKNLTREQMFTGFQSKLRANPIWIQYLHNYFKFYSGPSMQSFEIKPILKAFEEFEMSLRVEIGKIDPKIWNKLDNPKREFFKLLQIWALLIQKIRPLTENCHETAIMELVSPEIVDKIYGR